MAGTGVLTTTCVRPARGVVAQPAGPRPKIGSVAVPGQEGPEGPSGPPGAPGDAPTPYPLTGVASFVARHGFGFVPATWIVTADGELVEADVFHAPGMTTVMFPAPFTGTLYLR